MIALTSDSVGLTSLADPSVSTARTGQLLSVVPNLRVAGRETTPELLAQHLGGMWLQDETVLYIGKATSLASRARQYYATKLGARSPHAGGWPLKVLDGLEEMWVHWATHLMPELAEQQALAAFTGAVSEGSRSVLLDPRHPYPYANLEGPGGRKQHGITGARLPRVPSAPNIEPTPIPENARRATHASEDEPRKLTLHEEIRAILQERSPGSWMTTQELADAVNRRGRYRKQDASPMTAFQIHGRTKNYPHLFERDGNRVRLRLR